MGGEIVFENATARISAMRNVVVVCWADAPRTTVELREFEKAGKRVSAQHDRRAIFANVIVSGTPSFSQEVRDEVTRLTRQPMFQLGTAQIILVGGLAGVAVRAFLNTSFILSRTTAPNKVFAELANGIQWMHTQLQKSAVTWLQSDLTTFVERAVGHEKNRPHG